jgi:exonuclease VII small subunit
MTVEEFISEYRDGKRAMKQKEDELEFANKLMEKLREENKSLKGNAVTALDNEIQAELDRRKGIQKMNDAASMVSRATDTRDLTWYELKPANDMAIIEVDEEEDPDKLKEKIADLSQKLQEARSKINSLTKEREKLEKLKTANANKAGFEEDSVAKSAVAEPVSHSQEEDFSEIDERLRR